MWRDEARGIFDEAYGLDWRAHIRRLNERFGLHGDRAFLDVPTVPEFFWGDLAGFRPREWVAVVSLNPQVRSADSLAWQQRQPWTPDSLWAYLNRHDLRGFREDEFYYGAFARRLVRLARAALPTVTEADLHVLLRRMGLFEVVPYPSRRYPLTTHQTLDLCATDAGSRVSLGIALAVVHGCPPAALLLNGNAAADALVQFAGGGWDWSECRYPSADRDGKRLRHWEATVATGEGPVPVFAFPQRSPRSHNSNAEIGQLAARIAQAVHAA